MDKVQPHSRAVARGSRPLSPFAFRNDGDLEAARQLVLSHLRFVVHIARGYSGYGPAAGRRRPGR
jgi:DNA-directed RNA polymerase sigma subunit (sigma70/sigma32)